MSVLLNENQLFWYHWKEENLCFILGPINHELTQSCRENCLRTTFTGKPCTFLPKDYWFVILEKRFNVLPLIKKLQATSSV